MSIHLTSLQASVAEVERALAHLNAIVSGGHPAPYGVHQPRAAHTLHSETLLQKLGAAASRETVSATVHSVLGGGAFHPSRGQAMADLASIIARVTDRYL